MKENNKGIKVLYIFAIIVIAIITKSVVGTILNPISSSMRQQSDQNIVDSLSADLNNELGKFNNTEELHNYVGTKLKNSEIVTITAPMGFFMQADILKEFCMPTGYVPEKYIREINSYKTDYDLDEEYMEFFNQQGLKKEQSKLLLQKTKEITVQQLKRFTENDFLLFLKTEPSGTKKDYCKIYDAYVDDIISERFKELDKTIPSGYKKYLRKH